MIDKISSKNYNLPDFEIFNSKKENDFKIWIPDKKYIVIGRSNNVNDSVYIDKLEIDKIEILKRPSGGESVVLSPNTIVLAVKIKIENGLNAHNYFEKINKQIISVLTKLGIKNLNQKGISDISIGNKKILGSSIYRQQEKVFYHAVLNVSEPVSTISKYLKHPKKEPDYRKGRSHSEFVSSISNEGYSSDNKLYMKNLAESLSGIRLNF